MTADAASEAPAWAVLDRFLAAFTAADAGALAALFWPDALVWGTTMPRLATEAGDVAAYFAPLGGRRPGERRAVWGGGAALAVSEAAILLSGTWRVEAESATAAGPFRLSLATTRRDGAWRIAQFHNSPRPGAG